MYNGIIFQRGSNIYEYYFNILKYAIKKDTCFRNLHETTIIGLYSNNQNEKDLIKINEHYNLTNNYQIILIKILFYIIYLVNKLM